jgi:hypothetical protein
MNGGVSLWEMVRSIIIPVFAPLAAILAGIWYTATWTATQESKLLSLQSRILEIESVVKTDRTQDARIGQLEYRLNWMDEEKKNDRAERKQIDREIRESLERLNNVVIRLEASDPYKRRH